MGQKAKLHPQYAAGLRDAIAMLDQGEAEYEQVRERLMEFDAAEVDIAKIGFAADTLRAEKAELQRFLDLAEKLGRKPTAEELRAALVPFQEKAPGEEPEA